MSVMSNADPWFSSVTRLEEDGDHPSKSTNNMDAELASIVSSLSALSNPAHNSTSDRRGSTQLGGFRRPSLSYGGPGTTTAAPPAAAGNSQQHTTGAMGPMGMQDDASSQSSSPIVARRTALSVGTAPPYNGGYQDETSSLSGQRLFGATGRNSYNNRMNFMGHYSASIAGPILFNHSSSTGDGSGGGGFFEKFGKSLIEGTRELENSSSSDNVNHEVSGHGSPEGLSAPDQLLANPVLERRRASVTSNSTASESVEQFQEAAGKSTRNIWNVANAPVFKPIPNGHGDQFMMSTFPPQSQQQASQGSPFPPPFMPQFLPQTLASPPIPPNPVSATASPPSAALPLAQNPYLYMGGDLYHGIPSPQVQEQLPQANEPPKLPPQGVATGSAPDTNANVSAATTTSLGVNANTGVNARVAPTIQGKRSIVGKSSSKKLQANPYLDNTNNSSTSNTHGPNGNRNSSASPHPFHGKATFSNKKKNNMANKVAPPTSSHGKVKNGGSNGAKWSSYYTVRSPVLDEFRTNPTNKVYNLKDIVGYVLEFCQDQHGSRFIQYELASASPSEREVIFNEIRDQSVELSDDVFGNYVIQKFFEFGSKTQKDILVSQFKGRMQELSMQMYACRVIQRALEFIDLEQRIDLVKELSTCVLEMIKDQNGNHVIQKAIERIPMVELPFILDSLDGQIYHLSTHAYGCRVIQRLLEFGSEEDQTRIFREIKDFIPFLIQDQYGNYVIQHVLQQNGDKCLQDMAETKQNIVNIVSQSVVEFSKHKFASNVVEKAILFGTKEQRDLIMSKIMPRDEANAANLEENSPMVLMMRDQFANYVVQKLVGVSEGQEKRLIVIAIKSYLEKLSNSEAVGNRNLASVEKLASLVETVTI